MEHIECWCSACQPLLTDFNVIFQAERDEEEIAEVEMILETYFMHVDNTFNKLQTLCEYIDDTEVSPQGRRHYSLRLDVSAGMRAPS